MSAEGLIWFKISHVGVADKSIFYWDKVASTRNVRAARFPQDVQLLWGGGLCVAIQRNGHGDNKRMLMAARQTEWSLHAKRAQSCKTKPHLRAVNASLENRNKMWAKYKKGPRRGRGLFNLIWTEWCLQRLLNHFCRVQGRGRVYISLLSMCI